MNKNIAHSSHWCQNIYNVWDLINNYWICSPKRGNMWPLPGGE